VCVVVWANWGRPSDPSALGSSGLGVAIALVGGGSGCKIRGHIKHIKVLKSTKSTPALRDVLRVAGGSQPPCRPLSKQLLVAAKTRVRVQAMPRGARAIGLLPEQLVACDGFTCQNIKVGRP
ncbi:hypothetical protein HaLaN_30421, partial [Haematococcus lacustris]